MDELYSKVFAIVHIHKEIIIGKEGNPKRKRRFNEADSISAVFLTAANELAKSRQG